MLASSVHKNQLVYDVGEREKSIFLSFIPGRGKQESPLNVYISSTGLATIHAFIALATDAFPLAVALCCSHIIYLLCFDFAARLSWLMIMPMLGDRCKLISNSQKPILIGLVERDFRLFVCFFISRDSAVIWVNKNADPFSAINHLLRGCAVY